MLSQGALEIYQPAHISSQEHISIKNKDNPSTNIGIIGVRSHMSYSPSWGYTIPHTNSGIPGAPTHFRNLPQKIQESPTQSRSVSYIPGSLPHNLGVSHTFPGSLPHNLGVSHTFRNLPQNSGVSHTIQKCTQVEALVLGHVLLTPWASGSWHCAFTFDTIWQKISKSS